MDYEEYKRKALEPIVNYIESVLASYSKEEIEARIKEALPKKESEDERIKRFILTSLNYLIGIENSPGSDYDKQLKEAYSWLEKQKEQKPAEWSEEDEALIENVCTALKGYALHERKVDLDEHAHRLEEMSERLKSLRPWPHWRPSEQENGALRTAIHILTEERNFPKAAAQLQNILDVFEGEESRKDWKPSE